MPPEMMPQHAMPMVDNTVAPTELHSIINTDGPKIEAVTEKIEVSIKW